MADKIDRIFDTIDAAVRGLGCEVVDVEKRIEYGEVHITIYADKLPEGISLDDCERLHYAIEPLIDELDPTDGRPYVLRAILNAITARKWKCVFMLPSKGINRMKECSDSARTGTCSSNATERTLKSKIPV